MIDVLKDCLRNLCSGNQMLRGGGVELYDEAERKRIALGNMKSYHASFVRMGHKYEKFWKRIEQRVLRFQEQLDVGLIHPEDGRTLRVCDLEAFDLAMAAGYVFNPASFNSLMENPCREILIDMWHPHVAPDWVPESRVHIGGSPYPMHLNHAQLRLVTRGIYRWLQPCGKDSVIVECLPHIKLSKTVAAKLKSLSQNMRVTEMIHWFYNENKVPQYWQEIRNMRENLRGDHNLKLFAEGAAQFLQDALGTQKPCPNDWKTSTVIDLCKSMRESEDFGLMPILADALQDAGCDDEVLLTHYRNPKSRFSLGSWIFRATGTM